MENFFYQTFIFLFTPGDEGKGGCHTMDREGGGELKLISRQVICFVISRKC